MVEPSQPSISSFTGPYRFLSNFWPAPVRYDGCTYPSVEHAYQAAKTLDYHARASIRNLTKAGDAKRLGSRVVLRLDWESIKLDVMERLLRQKFAQEPLKGQLLATGEAELVEGNDWNDYFWGVCRGRGENHLGKLLMKIRSELK